MQKLCKTITNTSIFSILVDLAVQTGRGVQRYTNQKISSKGAAKDEKKTSKALQYYCSSH